MKEVYKFGGTSVDNLEQIANIIAKRLENYQPHVCVSAFSGITDKLIDFINKVEDGKADMTDDLQKIFNVHLEKIKNSTKNKLAIEHLTNSFNTFWHKKKEQLEKNALLIQQEGLNHLYYDNIIGIGEQISAFLLAELISYQMKSKGIKGKFIDLGKGVKGSFKVVNEVYLEALKNHLFDELINEKQENEIPIITGFIGKVPGGIVNVIDRGYTDFTGAFVSATIKAQKFIIFKEVDGICSTDPRIIPQAQLLKVLSYREVLKMASAGMKAINTEAIRPAMTEKIPIEVRNTFTPEQEGTLIVSKRDLNPKMVIQNIPIKKNVCIIRFIQNAWSKEPLEIHLTNVLAKHNIKKYFSLTDYLGICSVIANDDRKIEMLAEDLSAFGLVKLIKNCAIVAIVGEEMINNIGIVSKASQILEQENICLHMMTRGASEVGIDFVINEDKVELAVQKLHQTFFG